MATVVNTRASLADLLKIVYEPNLNEAVTSRALFLNAFMKKKYDGKGKEYRFATHLVRNTMVAARGADDYFEAGGPEKVWNGVVNPGYLHTPFEITHDLLVASKGDAHAFADGMKLIQNSAKEMLRRDMNRISVGDGRGILATVSANDAGGAGTRTISVAKTKFLEDGMLMDGWNGAAGVTIRNGSLVGGISQGPWFEVVTVVSETSVQIKMSDGSAVPALTAADVFTRKKNAYVDGGVRKSYEPIGLRLMADDGTLDPVGGLHGISSTAATKWKGIIRDAVGVDASPAVVSAVAQLYRRWSNTMFDTLWCHDNQAHGLIYGNEGSYKDKRWVNAGVEQIGANEEDLVITVSGQKVRVKTDNDLPEDELNFFDSKVIRYIELYPIQLLEQADGLFLTPWRDSTGQRHAQVGFWGWSGNFATVMRNAICRVYGLSTPATLAALQW